MNKPELKPCPFCGGKAFIVTQRRADPPYSYLSMRAQCQLCEIHTKEYPADGYMGYFVKPEKIAEIWNRRTSNADAT